MRDRKWLSTKRKPTPVEKQQQDFSMSVNSGNANTVTIDRDHYMELLVNAGDFVGDVYSTYCFPATFECT